MLSEGYLKYRNQSIALKYENFVSNTEIEIKNISDYLEINIDKTILNNFYKQDTKGSLGDPTGAKKYSAISTEGLEKWKHTFNSYLRKKFATRLIMKIDEESLKTQGYDKKEILRRIKGLNNKKNKFFFKDMYEYYLSFLIRKTNVDLLISKKFSWVKKKYLT